MALKPGDTALSFTADTRAPGRSHIRKRRFPCAAHIPKCNPDGTLVQPHICSVCGWELDDMMAQ